MVTQESRSALGRAQFFLGKAMTCRADERVDFEAYLEASIVFARSAVHRFKRRFGSHPEFRNWWDSVLADSAVTFTRVQRDWILKDASLKIGQKGYAASVGCQAPSWQPTMASDFYYFESPSIPATETVRRHLSALRTLLGEAEKRFLA